MGPGNECRDDSLGVARANQLSGRTRDPARSEEHTSELQSLMRISYAVFCLKKKKNNNSKKKTDSSQEQGKQQNTISIRITCIHCSEAYERVSQKAKCHM